MKYLVKYGGAWGMLYDPRRDILLKQERWPAGVPIPADAEYPGRGGQEPPEGVVIYEGPRGGTFWVPGGVDFTPQEYEVIEEEVAELSEEFGIEWTNPDAETFNAALEAFAEEEPDLAPMLTFHDPEEMRDHHIILSADGDVGAAVSPDGDVQNVFNNTEYGGAGSLALQKAIQAGGYYLDCFDTVLPDLYEKHGFRETGRMEWSDEAAPEGWNYEEFNRPDVVFMGYGAEQPSRGPTDRYYDDWSRAKQDSREAGGPRAGAGAAGSGADGGGAQLGSGASKALLREEFRGFLKQEPQPWPEGVPLPPSDERAYVGEEGMPPEDTPLWLGPEEGTFYVVQPGTGDPVANPLDQVTDPVHIAGLEGPSMHAMHDSGFEAYVVGGTVRDYFLGRSSKDVDVATDATPEEAMAAMEEAGLKAIPTGIEHGTITVVDPELGEVEFTTYRTEGEYEDARRPEEVEFVDDVREDLARRDLTINAIAYDPTTGEIVDPFGGKEDLDEGIIEAVGEPLNRFDEDGLRPIRAARFASTLGFDVEDETWAAMADPTVIASVEEIAEERIQEEMMKNLKRSDEPSRFFDILVETGLNAHVLPELEDAIGMEQPNQYHAYDVYGHILSTIDHTMPDPVIRLSMLFHDIGKPETQTFDDDGTPHFYGHEKVSAEMAKEAMRRLKFSNEMVDQVSHLVRHHMWRYLPEMNDSTVRRFIDDLGEENLEDWVQVRYADIHGKGKPEHMEEELDRLNGFLQRVEELRSEGDGGIPDLAIDGNDLMDMGFDPGPEMGELIDQLREYIAEDLDRNNPEELREVAQEFGEELYKDLLPWRNFRKDEKGFYDPERDLVFKQQEWPEGVDLPDDRVYVSETEPPEGADVWYGPRKRPFWVPGGAEPDQEAAAPAEEAEEEMEMAIDPDSGAGRVAALGVPAPLTMEDEWPDEGEGSTWVPAIPGEDDVWMAPHYAQAIKEADAPLRAVHPDDYMALLEEGWGVTREQVLAGVSDQAQENLIERFQDGEVVDPGFIVFDLDTGELTQQEGRNRTFLAGELGAEETPHFVLYEGADGEYYADPTEYDGPDPEDFRGDVKRWVDHADGPKDLERMHDLVNQIEEPEFGEEIPTEWQGRVLAYHDMHGSDEVHDYLSRWADDEFAWQEEYDRMVDQLEDFQESHPLAYETILGDERPEPAIQEDVFGADVDSFREATGQAIPEVDPGDVVSVDVTPETENSVIYDNLRVMDVDEETEEVYLYDEFNDEVITKPMDDVQEVGLEPEHLNLGTEVVFEDRQGREATGVIAENLRDDDELHVQMGEFSSTHVPYDRVEGIAEPDLDTPVEEDQRVGVVPEELPRAGYVQEVDPVREQAEVFFPETGVTETLGFESLETGMDIPEEGWADLEAVIPSQVPYDFDWSTVFDPGDRIRLTEEAQVGTGVEPGAEGRIIGVGSNNTFFVDQEGEFHRVGNKTLQQSNTADVQAAGEDPWEDYPSWVRPAPSYEDLDHDDRGWREMIREGVNRGEFNLVREGDIITYETSEGMKAGRVVDPMIHSGNTRVLPEDGETVEKVRPSKVQERLPSEKPETQRQEMLVKAARDAGIRAFDDVVRSYTGAGHNRYNNNFRGGYEKVQTWDGFQDEYAQYEMAVAALTKATTSGGPGSVRNRDVPREMADMQAITETKLPEEMTVWRGVSLPKGVAGPKLPDFREAAEEEGKTLRLPAFQSASLKKKTANSFGTWKYKIETDTGLYPREISKHPTEEEVILPAGAKYEVLDVDEPGRTIHLKYAGDTFKLDRGTMEMAEDIYNLQREEEMTFAEAREEMHQRYS